MKSSDVITESGTGFERPHESTPEAENAPETWGTRGAANETFTIGELAGHFGLGTHVLRHWESVGLLMPSARVNGRRRYSRAHFARVGLILGGKSVGMSLEEIRGLLTAPDGISRRDVLREHVANLERRMAEIQAARIAIDHIIKCKYEDFTECPHFQAQIEEMHHCETPKETLKAVESSLQPSTD